MAGHEPPPTPDGRPVEPPASGPAPVTAQIGRNAALLSFFTLISRLLGMVRESMIAATFDLASTDAFFVAWRVPNAMRAMLAEGAARYVFNPVLGDALHGRRSGEPENRERMRDALSEVRGAALFALVLTTGLGMLFARPIFALMSGGFSGDAARFNLGASLLGLLFPYLLFMGWFAVGNSALQIVGRIGPGAAAPVSLNVAFVLLPIALIPIFARFGLAPIYALAVAALAGGLLQVLWLVPALRQEGLAPRPRLRWSPMTRAMAVTFVAQLYGQAVYQINVILAGRFLAGLERGSASYFNYAQRLADIPQGLFAVALSGATAIALQRDASQKDLVKVARTFESSIRMAAVVALPMTVLLAVYGEALVPLIYGYGRFRRLGPNGMLEVVDSLRWQCVGIAFLAFVHQTTAVFGALQRRRTVVGAATVSLAVFGVVGTIATPRLGHSGVAVAMAASSGAQLIVLLVLVARAVPVKYGHVLPTVARALAAAGLTALAARGLVTYAPLTGLGTLPKVLTLFGGAALVTLYVVSAWLLGCDEVRDVVNKVRSRLGRGRSIS